MYKYSYNSKHQWFDPTVNYHNIPQKTCFMDYSQDIPSSAVKTASSALPLIDYSDYHPPDSIDMKKLSENRPLTLHPFMMQFNNPYPSQVELESYLYDYTKPRYVGCYQDSSYNRVFPKYLGIMRPKDCAERVASAGYKKYGLQNGPGQTYGQAECWTGNDTEYNAFGSASDCT